MIPHFNIMINRSMFFETILLLKSIQKFSGLTNYLVSIAIEQEDSKVIPKFIEDNATIISFDKKHSKFNPYYLGGLQRWQIPIKGDVQILIDADFLILNNLGSLETKNVMGVIAAVSPFKENSNWENLSSLLKKEIKLDNLCYFSKEKCPSTYFNYGFVIVPNKYYADILNSLEEMINIVHNYSDNYFNGQIAFCLAIEKLNIPYNELPIKYNFQDMYLETMSNYEEIIGLHNISKMFLTKKKLTSLLFNTKKNRFIKFVSKKIQLLTGLYL